MATTDDNVTLVRRFYDSFARGDAAGMNACYGPDVTFKDPVFGELDAARTRAMWTMLCRGMRDFTLTYEIVESNEKTVKGKAIATYLYSATGRKVRNEISGTFGIKNGQIERQDDSFDLWKWSSQALGAAGALLGWTPFMKAKIHAMASERLETFMRAA